MINTLARAAVLGLLMSVSAVAGASGSGVVISQVYGGGGTTYNRDYVELFNAGNATVNITGWSVQYASATGTGTFSGNGVAVLNGSLAPGQYHLVAMASSAGGAAVPTPDTQGTASMSSSAGKVILANVNTGLACNGASTPCSPAQLAQIVDLVGYGSANFFEGAGAAPALTASTAARRSNRCSDTDANSADFVAGAPQPHNSASPLEPCSGDQPLSLTCPAAVNVAQGSSIDLALSATDPDGLVNAVTFGGGQATGMSLGGFTAAASTGGTATAILTVGASVAAGSYPAVQVRFSTDLGQSGTCSIAITVGTPGGAYTPIFQIQGSGSQSPLVGSTVTTRGVVTRVNNNGYYLQDAAGDGNAETSDGLFVFTSSSPTVTVGQLIEISGSVAEFNTGAAGNPHTSTRTVTELVPSGSPLVLAAGQGIAPVAISLPETVADELERYEGMLVQVTTPMVVSQNYFQGRYGQVTLSAQARLIKPTQLHRPGLDAQALAALNQRASLILDDGSSLQNPNPIPYIGADNTLRAGDTVSGLIGVIDFGLATADNTGLADWRIHPTAAPVIARANARPITAPSRLGNVRVSAFNVLNYFTTFTNGQTASGSTGQGCTPSGTTADCRGADSLAEFNRQRDKIIQAIRLLDADVLGLMEIQNNGTVAAQNLVDGLNAAMGAGTYAVVPEPPTSGTDAIRVAMIYKPSVVTLVGGSQSDGDPIHNRPPMAQTFRLLANNEAFSVIVNHFKSKSCSSATGADMDQGDLQGCYNNRRTQQASRLLTFIGQVKAAAADNDVLVIGDLNAYGQEDPLFTLTSGGLVDQSARFAVTPHSYVFDGESGTLDHALASSSLSPRVLNAQHWPINADEPSVIDYNTEFKTQDLYSATAYRSSDHDPVVIDLDLQAPQAQTVTFAVLPDRVQGDPDFTVSASASSGLSVTFTSLTTAVCTVSGSTVHLVSTGTCSLAADQAGNSSYLPAARVTRSFVVKQVQIIIFPAPSPLNAGSTATLGGAASSGLSVTYSTSTPAVCSVSGAVLTALASGNCVITATQAGNGIWAPAVAVSHTVTVQATGGGTPNGDVPLPWWAVVMLGAGLARTVKRARRPSDARP